MTRGIGFPTVSQRGTGPGAGDQDNVTGAKPNERLGLFDEVRGTILVSAIQNVEPSKRRLPRLHVWS